ncbi:hypothetical protein rosag_20470 [Roseisolibacter agri]|uniref:Uncharacterized protein n=2 Tax=Roseisolibacter agri TaxID=2014610 RepID=A0AA37Q2S8_9BACT|nr:hypothetical protein rosag_20470 [Roseisolibacter agri]
MRVDLAAVDHVAAALGRAATDPRHRPADRQLFEQAHDVDQVLRAGGREWEAFTAAQLALRLREALKPQPPSRGA